MRIIEITSLKEIEERCQSCRTRFAFFLSEARLAQDQSLVEGIVYVPTRLAIDCPICKTTIIHSYIPDDS